MSVIYDCMVFVQALASNTGTSARCLEAVERGDVTLIVSNATLLEVEDLLHRDSLRGSVILCNDATIRAYLDHIVAVAHKVNAIPMVWSLYRDPKDEKYLNLAIVADAKFISNSRPLATRPHDCQRCRCSGFPSHLPKY